MSDITETQGTWEDGGRTWTPNPLSGPSRFGELSKLATALAKAQSEIEDASKDSQNPHFKSRYADLASVRAAIRGPLSANGIAYVQLVRTADKNVEVETILIHGESGQSIGETLSLPMQQNTPQAVGSCISYGRRYALMAIVGLAADDDDGEGATRGNGSAPKANGRKSSAQNKRDDVWGALNADILDAGSAAALAKLREDYRVNVYPNLSQDWREQAEEAFDKRAAELTAENLAETLADSVNELVETPDQIQTYRELSAHLRKASSRDELKKKASAKQFKDELDNLTEKQRATLQDVYHKRFDELHPVAAL